MADQNNHLPNGKFAPGNKMGRGNPLNRRAQALRAQALRYMDPQKLWDVLDMLFHKAVDEKDVQAAKELLDRALGKAKQAVELTGQDGSPVRTKPETVKIDYEQLVQELEAFAIQQARGRVSADGDEQSVHSGRTN